MDVALEQLEQSITSDIRGSAGSAGPRFHRHLHASFGSAFQALALALTLPGIVCVFAAIRAREFQLVPDSRWARFAPFVPTKPPTLAKHHKAFHSGESGRLPVQTASIKSEPYWPAPPPCRPELERRTAEPSLTNNLFEPVEQTGVQESIPSGPPAHVETQEAAVSGSQIPVPSQPTPNVDAVPTPEANPPQSSHRIEAQVQLIHDRLDQLINQWVLSQPVQREPVQPDVSSHEGSKDKVNRASLIRIQHKQGTDSMPVFAIDAQDADIRQLFVKLSEAAGVGILASPSVQGSITFHLPPVRLETAVRAIALSQNLDFRRERGIIVIRTAEEAARSPMVDARASAKAFTSE